VRDSFQQAWRDAVIQLATSGWELRNLMVQTRNPELFDQTFHERVSTFAQDEDLLGPKDVAYTIFPHELARQRGNAAAVFEAYNRHNGLFERLHRRKPAWGTYFRRMTCCGIGEIPVNQLGNIINAINRRDYTHKAAYSIVIQNPGSETVRPRGGPCLNYVAVQLDPVEPVTLGLLAVYRNHDFLRRAYGNYWGLCNLLRFMAAETGSRPGPLTCVSSHAYVDAKGIALKQLVDGL
jgi:hypothetical protein